MANSKLPLSNIRLYSNTVVLDPAVTIDLGDAPEGVYRIPCGVFLNVDAMYVGEMAIQANRYIRLRSTYSGSADKTHTYYYCEIKLQ